MERIINKEIPTRRKLLAPWRLNWQLSSWKFRESYTKIGPVRIPERLEYEHFLICGATGTGKSTAARHIISQILQRGLPIIIIDPHGEFTAEFYDDTKDWLLNPFDARCPYWSPALEIEGPMDVAAVAKAMMRNRLEDSWHNAARRLITGLLTVDPGSILNLIVLPARELHKKLPENAKNVFDPNAQNQVSAVVGIASTVLEPLSHLPPKGERQWSAKTWGRNRSGRVFLTATETGREATRRLHGLWLDLLIRELLTDAQAPQTWLIASELPTMGYQPALERLLTEGRKYKASAVVEFQNVAQLRDIYGRDGAITIASSPATQILLNPGNEPETALWVNRVLGDYELNPEVQQLKAGQAYLAVKGYDRARITLRKRNLTPCVQSFIPRDEPTETVDTLDKQKVARERKRLAAIISRCHKPSDPAYKDYGARGITVYPAWRTANGWRMYINYLLMTIGLPIAENFSLDRINNNEGYWPWNLCWNTREGQAANKRKAREHAPSVPA